MLVTLMTTSSCLQLHLSMLQSRFRTIKSVRSEMFLVSDENGKAFMREIKDLKGGQPEDRQAWFDLIDYDDMVPDSMFTFISEDMLTFTAKPCEA